MMPEQRDTNLPVFIINLPQAVARRQEILTRLEAQGLTGTFIEAVDGRKLSEQKRESLVDRHRAQVAGWALSPSEIGCALSHINVYRQMVEQEIPHAIVLEDDVILSSRFARLCQQDSAECLARHVNPDQAAMIQLTHVKRAYRYAAQPLPGNVYSLAKPFSGVWLTSGYFITLGAARNLLKALYPVWSVADDWSHFEAMGLLSVSVLTPNPVWEAESAQTSSIESGRSKNNRRKPRTLAHRLNRLWRDLILKPFFVRRLPDGQTRETDQDQMTKRR